MPSLTSHAAIGYWLTCWITQPLQLSFIGVIIQPTDVAIHSLEKGQYAAYRSSNIQFDIAKHLNNQSE